MRDLALAIVDLAGQHREAVTAVGCLVMVALTTAILALIWAIDQEVWRA